MEVDDRKILELYPLPIARGYRRYRNASEIRERHDYAFFLFEIYLKYTAAIAISHYLESDLRDHRVNVALKGLARPSLGEWMRFNRECLRHLAGREDADPAVQAMAALFRERASSWTEAVRLFNEMRRFRSGDAGDKEQVGLEALLGEVVVYRNRVLGHGAPLDAEHYRRFGELFAAAYREVLARSPFLTARRLLSFGSIQVREGSRVECEAIEYMGLQPIRRDRPHVVAYGEPAPRQHCLYLMSEDGRMLLLDPLLLAHREDVFILNEADGAPEYLSYSTGERHRPSSLAGAQGKLFERILGYEVDERRLSRIGDDLERSRAIEEEAGPEAGGKRLGDYRIVREIGRGAMGAVYEAVQESLGRRAALKILPGTFALDVRRLERFHREARATAQIHHPSIVPVYEVGESEGVHYYAMEYIDGQPLDRHLDTMRERKAAAGGRKGSASSDPGYIARCVEQVSSLAEGLDLAHRRGLVHRDVKPSNILVDPEGNFVLVDFGLVHEIDAQSLTRSGEMVGTLNYMSPEQVSRSRVDARSDVYSLAVTLYEMLTLRLPFDGTTEPEIQRAILFEEPLPPRRFNPRLNRDLETILLHALGKNPDRRYPSTAEFAADLDRFLRYEPIQARPQSALTRLARRVWRQKLRVAAAVSALLLVIAAGLIVYMVSAERQRRKEIDYTDKVLEAVMRIPLGFLDKGEEEEFWPNPIREAVAALEQSARILPARPEAYYHRARGLLLLGRDRDALAEVDKALECDRAFVPAVVLRRVILEKLSPGERPGAAEPAGDAAAPSEEEQWAVAWLRAHEAMEDRQWAAAVDAYSSLAAIQGEGRESYLGLTMEVRLGLGRAQLEQRKFAEALIEFGGVKGLWPKMLEPDLLLGKTFCLMEDIEKAEAQFLAAFERSPDEAALRAAAIYHDLGDHRSGLRWVERMSAGRIREVRKADFLRHLGDLDRAIETARAAEAKYPGHADVHCSVGNILQAKGDLEAAIAEYRKAIEIDRRYRRAHNDLGTALRQFDTKNLDGAIAEFEEAIRIDPDFAIAHYNLGNAYRDKKNPDKAIAAFRKALEIDSNYTNAYYNLGLILYDTGKLQDAANAFRNALRRDPDHLFSAGNLARALADMGDFNGSLEAGAQLQAIAERRAASESGDPENRREFVRVLSFLADLSAQAERPEAAREHQLKAFEIQRLLATVPEPTANDLNDYAWALLTCSVEELRDPETALVHARRAVQLSEEKNPDMLDTLAMAHFQNGDPARAIEIEEQAIRLLPAAPAGSESTESLRKSLEANLEKFRAGLAAPKEEPGPDNK